MPESPTDEDPIPGLLRRIQACGDEETIAAARDEMYEYQANALARPVRGHVDFIRGRLRARLERIIAAAKREGVRIE